MSILELQDITQEFGGLHALEHVNLQVEEEQIFGVIGPNGAGKTTLFNIVSGIYVPTQGRLVFKGEQLNHVAPHDIARLGIARTFQNIRLFNKLSVLDNVRVGSHGITKSGLFSGMLRLPAARREEKLIMEQAKELLNMLGLYEKRWEYAESLAYGEQRRLEIARALALNPSLLLLDEPAAGMNPQEKEELMQLIQQIRGERHVTILLVEHDMNLVMNICDRLAVLDYGKKIADGTPEEIKNDARVVESYLGVGA